jgi:sugar phosphate isomerase/epimerase
LPRLLSVERLLRQYQQLQILTQLDEMRSAMPATLGLLTDSVAHLTLDKVLDLAQECGLTGIELATGGWSTAPHLDLTRLLSSKTAREELLGQIEGHGLTLTALNCSGNPLHPGPSGALHDQTARRTFELAGHLCVDRVIMMSGLPGGPGDANPNWITVSWPPETTGILDWQWQERVLPYWRQLITHVCNVSDALPCLEMHAHQAVFSPTTFLRLRDEFGDAVAANLDPSHLIWMGADPLAAIDALGPAIGHVHAKDAKVEPAAALTGRQETLPPARVRERSWNYTTVGYGQDVTFWRAFFLGLSRIGYVGAINIEHEDYSMGREEGVRKAAEILHTSAVQTGPDYSVQDIAPRI